MSIKKHVNTAEAPLQSACFQTVRCQQVSLLGALLGMDAFLARATKLSSLHSVTRSQPANRLCS